MSTATAEIKESIITEPSPLHSKFWDKWIGKEIVIQTKGKALVVGVFKEFRNTFLVIEQASVTGTQKRVRPPVVLVDRNYISHFHEKVEVEDVGN
jgi:hypothetical protein